MMHTIPKRKNNFYLMYVPTNNEKAPFIICTYNNIIHLVIAKTAEA